MTERMIFEAADERSNKLRELVAEMDQQVSHLPAGTPLTQSWQKLVAGLALEPAHELRRCPKCNAVAMKEATLCSGCWAKLSPPA